MLLIETPQSAYRAGDVFYRRGNLILDSSLRLIRVWGRLVHKGRLFPQQPPGFPPAEQGREPERGATVGHCPLHERDSVLGCPSSGGRQGVSVSGAADKAASLMR